MPWRSQSGLLVMDALMTVKSGSKSASSASLGRMNIFFTKCACHATSMTKRTFKQVSLLAPQNPSTIYSFLPVSCLPTRSLSSPHTSGVIGLLSFFAPFPFHHKLSFVVSSMTINLSFGDRPVYSPVNTLTAPSSLR